MMNTRSIFLSLAGAALVWGCARESFTAAPEDGAKIYRFEAEAADAMTKARFNEDEAPSRYIYWEDDDAFDFHDITLSEGNETVSVTSGTPESVAVDRRSVLFEQAAHDYMVITYPAGAVTVENGQAIVHVPREQKLSSVLSPDLLPMTTSKLALSEAARAAVADGSDEVAVDFSNPVKFYPLAGLVKMKITGLPEVESARISKVMVRTVHTDLYSAGSPQLGIHGETVFSLKGEMEYLSTYAAGNQYSRGDVELSADEPLDYTAEEGTQVCFVVNHSGRTVNKIQVEVITSEGAAYQKTFDFSKADPARDIAFSRSRISSFEVDFTDGTATKLASTRFDVEWSKGYLVYDEENKTYKIGAEDEIGLYFKFGSPTGYAFYTSTEDYNSRIYPGQPLDAQTSETGICTFCTIYYSTGRAPILWTDRTCYAVNGTELEAKTLSSVIEYARMEGSTSFEGANDPCALVKVGEGEKQWRIPNKEEILNLIEVGSPGIEMGNFDGTDMVEKTPNPRYVRLSDGEQSLTFKACSYINCNLTAGVTQIISNQKGQIFFWSNEYLPGAREAQNAAACFNMNLSGSVDKITKRPEYLNKTVYKANRPGVIKDEAGETEDVPVWDAMSVRCVRDKN